MPSLFKYFLYLFALSWVFVLPPDKSQPVNSSIDQPKEKLRALVVYSSTSYFLYRGKTMGFEYELLERLADNLNLELEIVISESTGELIPDLLAGKGDLIAHALIITPDRSEYVAFTEPVSEVKQVLVQRKPEGWRQMSEDELTQRLTTDYRELIGDSITVSRGTAIEGLLKAFNDSIGGGIHTKVLDDAVSSAELIEMVNDGSVKYTVAHGDIASINASWLPEVDVSVVAGKEHQRAWAVRKEDTALLRKLNTAVLGSRNSLTYNVIYNKYFKNTKYFETRVNSPLYSLKNNAISEFDTTIREHADRIGWDWRLIASLIYQESRFNPEAESWAGAAGLMQLMPRTAEAMGVTNSLDPQDNIKGGCTLLERLYKRFSHIKDHEERMKFVLAAYNCGIGHVFDAQRLADAEGRDRNKWEGHIDEMLLQLSDPEHYNRKMVRYGYVRGRETVKYVTEILQRFDHYQNTIQL